MHNGPHFIKKIAFLLICFLAVQSVSFGQPADPPETLPDDVPITGIEILIGLGGLLGAKKYFDLRKGKKE